MIQFFKEPIIKDCSCKACMHRLIKPVGMRGKFTRDKVMDRHMPMPIPKPIGVGDNKINVE